MHVPLVSQPGWLGFSPGEFNPFTGLYIVRNTDAYAMTEVYFLSMAGLPLPDSWSSTNSTFDRGEPDLSVLKQFWKWVGWLPTCDGLLNNVFGAIFSWIKKAITFSSVLPRLGRRLHWANRDWIKFLRLAGLEPVASVALP